LFNILAFKQSLRRWPKQGKPSILIYGKYS
jgi:hypothetical protein